MKNVPISSYRNTQETKDIEKAERLFFKLLTVHEFIQHVPKRFSGTSYQ